MKVNRIQFESPRADMLKDMVSCVLHTIVFNRALGLTQPREAKCLYLNAYYMKCGDVTYEQIIDQKVSEFLENASRPQEGANSGEICIQFFTQQSSLTTSFFAGQAKREYWERWELSVRLLPSTSKAAVDEDDQVQQALGQVALGVSSSLDYVPQMYEGLKCYQFDIEVSKKLAQQSQAGAGHGRAGSFFDGFFKKLTTN